MAKLYFRYGAMGAGKTMDILKVAYNYEDLQNVMKEFNEDATYDDLKNLAEAYKYEDAVARRAE